VTAVASPTASGAERWVGRAGVAAGRVSAPSGGGVHPRSAAWKPVLSWVLSHNGLCVRGAAAAQSDRLLVGNVVLGALGIHDPDRSVDEVGPFAVGVILSLVTGSSLGMPSAQLVGGLRIRMATVPGRPGRLTPAPDGGRSSSDSGAVPLPLPARHHQCAPGSAPAFVLGRTSRESLATALLRADSGTRESTRSSGGRAQSYVPRVRVKTDREARRSRAASRPRRTSYRRGRRLGSARS